MRILLVDDDAATLDVLDLALSLQGHDILRATDGRQGVDMALASSPDLILLDSMMPVMDGLSAAREIREHPAISRTPIIMLTAKALDSDVWTGWQAGVDSYITKPLDLTVLGEEMDRIVREMGLTLVEAS